MYYYKNFIVFVSITTSIISLTAMYKPENPQPALELYGSDFLVYKTEQVYQNRPLTPLNYSLYKMRLQFFEPQPAQPIVQPKKQSHTQSQKK